MRVAEQEKNPAVIALAVRSRFLTTRGYPDGVPAVWSTLIRDVKSGGACASEKASSYAPIVNLVMLV